MTTATRRIVDMVLRVLGFLHANPFDEPAHMAVASRLEDRATRIQTLAEQEQSGHIAARAASLTKQNVREKIIDALNFLGRVAATALLEEPEIPVRLSIPRPHSSQLAFLTGGRVVVTQAQGRQDVLTKHGMPAGFLEQLSALLDQYEQSINAKNDGTSAHVGASAELEGVALEINRLVRLLDAVYRPLFRNDPEKRAAWKSAKDVVRPAPKPDTQPAKPGGEAQPAA